MILISKYLVPKGFTGISIYPFIFLNEESLKQDEVLINQERIHLEQQKELLIIFFYMLYILEWVFKYVKYRNSYLAYRNLSFEREAYQNETKLNYLQNRKYFSFLNYFKSFKELL